MSSSSFTQRYGPWALVTGAAQGLGAAFCEELVERGLSVLALDVREDRLAEQVDRLRGRGGRVEPVVLDLREDLLEHALEAAIAEREVGLLINNAALAIAEPLLDQPLDQLRSLQRVNCDAPLIATRVLGQAMRARGRGGIVMVSSLSSLLGGPIVGHYAATKAFGAILAESLHEELRNTGIDVTTVLAPLMETPGMRETRPARLTSQVLTPATVACAALDALGRRGRIVVGRAGRLFVALERVLPRATLRRIVANNLRTMYPDRA